VEELRALTPLQNGNSARLIAQVGRELLGDGARARDVEISHLRATPRPTPRPQAGGEALVA
jgi:hypothetical protein